MFAFPLYFWRRQQKKEKEGENLFAAPDFLPSGATRIIVIDGTALPVCPRSPFFFPSTSAFPITVLVCAVPAPLLLSFQQLLTHSHARRFNLLPEKSQKN
uniref:Uncharacterized protein n=1 Tax=Globodera rostochiensis TaxID=31243 RepID=A0A914I9U6_GLORO